jgi:hypothetical protein
MKRWDKKTIDYHQKITDQFQGKERKVEKNTVRNSFQRGFQWYKNHVGYELSTREIEELFPEVDSTAFYQGMEDAKYNDTFRINRE